MYKILPWCTTELALFSDILIDVFLDAESGIWSQLMASKMFKKNLSFGIILFIFPELSHWLECSFNRSIESILHFEMLLNGVFTIFGLWNTAYRKYLPSCENFLLLWCLRFFFCKWIVPKSELTVLYSFWMCRWV